MADSVGTYGTNHARFEKVACFEFNLDELYKLKSLFSLYDTFQKDIQSAIDKIEVFGVK